MRFLLGLAVAVVLASASRVEAYTWADVLSTIDTVYVEAGATVWVEKYEKHGDTGYRIWKRPTNTISGGQRTKTMLFFPSTSTVTEGAGANNLLCNGSGGTDSYTTPITWYGGGRCASGSSCTGLVSGDYTQYVLTVDCHGRELAAVATPLASIGGTSRTNVCWVAQGYSPNRNASSCKTQDILVADIWPVETGSCEVGISSTIPLKGEAGAGGDQPRAYKAAACDCIPDGFVVAGEPQVFGETCEVEVRPVVGDPGILANVAGGLQVMPDGTYNGVPLDAGELTIYPAPTGGSNAIAGGTAATGSGTGSAGVQQVQVVGGGSTGGGGGASAEDVQEGVEAALGDGPAPDPGSNPSVPGPGESYGFGGEWAGPGTAPEAESITGLLLDFIANSPFLQIIADTSVTAAGSCAISGGSGWYAISLDFCPTEPWLALVGAFLLGIAKLYAVMVIFGYA